MQNSSFKHYDINNSDDLYIPEEPKFSKIVWYQGLSENKLLTSKGNVKKKDYKMFGISSKEGSKKRNNYINKIINPKSVNKTLTKLLPRECKEDDEPLDPDIEIFNHLPSFNPAVINQSGKFYNIWYMIFIHNSNFQAFEYKCYFHQK